MNAASNARQTKDAALTDERGGGEQRTVVPTRTRARVRAAVTSRECGRTAERGDGHGPITSHSGTDMGKPLWEDDRGAMAPDERS